MAASNVALVPALLLLPPALSAARMHGPVGMTPGQFFPDSSARQWREQREMLVPDHLTAEDNIVRVAMRTWTLRSDDKDDPDRYRGRQ